MNCLLTTCVVALALVAQTTNGFVVPTARIVDVRRTTSPHHVAATTMSAIGNMFPRRRLNSALKAETGSSTAAAAAAPKKGGEATIATSTFNLAKSIIGAGVLSLPSGVAFFSSSPAALIPAIAILTAMGFVAAYTFSLIGKSCEQHNAGTFKQAWEKSVDPNTAWMISGGITAKCFFASLAYSIIIGDSFSALAQTFGLPAFFANRSNIIMALTTLVLFPLCSLKSLNALAPFSLLGLGGTLYTAVAMAMRYFDKTYAVGGKFYSTLAIAARPSFSKSFGGLNVKAFVLLSMLSTAFIAHYNAPAFYRELKDPSMPRYNRVTIFAFAAAIALYTFVMSIGFLTFGGATAGFVLNNYASTDSLITVARLAVGLSIITGYPFTFFSLREGLLDLAKVTDMEKRTSLLRPLTIGMMTIITALAIVLRDVGFVVSLSGAGFGSILMFIVPALMNIANTQTAAKNKGVALKQGEQAEIATNKIVVVLGVLFGILGVTVSTLRQLGKM